jgi:hypothetical protein
MSRQDSKVKMRRLSKPKLTDAERYQRFLEAAKEVGASDDPKDFDEAFKKIAHHQEWRQPSSEHVAVRHKRDEPQDS